MIDCSVTKNYFKERTRMVEIDNNSTCTIRCVNCPLSTNNNGMNIDCRRLETFHIEKAVAIVQKWSDEHPRKTYKDDFFEKFPNATKDANELPKCCRENVYGIAEQNSCDCSSKNCYKCWNEVIP